MAMMVSGNMGEGSSMAKMVDGDGRNNISIKPQGEDNEFFRQLWLKCAGPLVTLPRVGDKVFYFPQGHVEQIEACTRKDIDAEMPIYNLPDRILCKVVCVYLQAEPSTDEVFAQITLLPEREGSIFIEESAPSSPVKSDVRTFTKKLTPSDTSTHGGFSIPKRPADECFPNLDMSQDPPAQELVAKDLHGLEWHFRHVYRGHPKRHLITTGWSNFVTTKKLAPGDTCIFLRAPNGDLYVGVRRAKIQQTSGSASVLSSQSMQHGILASAFHAVSTGTMFNVYYRPCTSPSEFIIPYHRYIYAAEIEYEIGAKFRMQFERRGDEFRGPRCPRFAGAIIGIEDIDQIRWPCSEWRCLKVKWEADPESLVLPERVSPWSIELIESSKRKNKPIESYPKRLRPFDPSVPFIINNDLPKNRDGLTNPRQTGVLQGQEIRNENVIACESAQQSRSNLTLHPSAEWKQVQVGLDKEKDQRQDGKDISLAFANSLSPTISSYENYNTFGACSTLPVRSVNSLNYEYQEKGGTEALGSQPNGNGKFMLFGINLHDSHAELTFSQTGDEGGSSHSKCLPPDKANDVEENSLRISRNLLENQCNNCCFLTSRSCTKILKYGTALGRSIDLSRLNGYNELISQLDEMFEFSGTLANRSCGWQVTYTDGEGDLMLLGDYPWQEFRTMVRKMFIRPKNAANFVQG